MKGPQANWVLHVPDLGGTRGTRPWCLGPCGGRKQKEGVRDQNPIQRNLADPCVPLAGSTHRLGRVIPAEAKMGKRQQSQGRTQQASDMPKAIQVERIRTPATTSPSEESPKWSLGAGQVSSTPQPGLPSLPVQPRRSAHTFPEEGGQSLPQAPTCSAGTRVWWRRRTPPL